MLNMKISIRTRKFWSILFFTILYFPLVICKLEAQKQKAFGCNVLDHIACDELCKSDSYWYGHCSVWDGMDFQCKCYEYKKPLDGSVCADSQSYCMEICQKKKDGGYCYPQASSTNPKGIPQCKCFERLPDIGFSAV